NKSPATLLFRLSAGRHVGQFLELRLSLTPRAGRASSQAAPESVQKESTTGPSSDPCHEAAASDLRPDQTSRVHNDRSRRDLLRYLQLAPRDDETSRSCCRGCTGSESHLSDMSIQTAQQRFARNPFRDLKRNREFQVAWPHDERPRD